jgi:hypothetical protein
MKGQLVNYLYGLCLLVETNVQVLSKYKNRTHMIVQETSIKFVNCLRNSQAIRFTRFNNSDRSLCTKHPQNPLSTKYATQTLKIFSTFFNSALSGALYMHCSSNSVKIIEHTKLQVSHQAVDGSYSNHVLI